VTRVVVAGGADIPPVARALRDLGVEVIYVAPDQVVGTAIQEDADAVAVDRGTRRIAAELAELDAADIRVLTHAEALEWVAGRYQ